MNELTKNRGITTLLSEIKYISKLLWEKGWAEANAGNFSINITKLIKFDVQKFNRTECIKTNVRYKYLKNNIILVTGTGSKMRDIANNPIPELCLLYINNNGDKYYNIPLINRRNVKPTSELNSHFKIQNLLSKKDSGENVLLHTHPSEVIALTHIKKYCNKKSINKLLYAIQPEVSFAFPDGIGFVPYYTTGSEKLARETKKKFTKHSIVLWEKHGCLATGKDLNDAFDKIDILVKSSKIFFMCQQTDNKPEGISVYNINKLKKLISNK